jgi:branched-chain amino acid transport system ATP-binding protein
LLLKLPNICSTFIVGFNIVLQVEHIAFGFVDSKPLFENLSLEIESGKIYALMGTNGAGKTTLFNIITGFLQPLNGNLYFNGRNITKLAPFKRNRAGISRTFQDLRFLTKLSVRENVILSMNNNPGDKWYNSLLPLSFYKKKGRLIEKTAHRIITTCFLENVVGSPAGDISYGQQKLLTLACCIANDAKLILLDEPVAGIQPEYCKKIETLIKQLKDEGKTVLLIEHNTDFIGSIADEIFFLKEGRVLSFDHIGELKKSSEVAEAYI